MANSQCWAGDERSAFSLLAHLEGAFGWTDQQALDALGTYLLTTEPGQRLRREQESCNRHRRAA